MKVLLRQARPDDASDVGRVCYQAFKSLSEHHRFAPDFESEEGTTGLMAMLLGHSGFYGVVAELDGRIVGSNFLDERSIVRGLGPISVDPEVQNHGVGRQMMAHMAERCQAGQASGLRLIQVAYHNRSLCLYTSCGYQTREPMSVMQGKPPGIGFAGYTVRPAQTADLESCNALCRKVHGFDRSRELADAIKQNAATVVDHLGTISGYSTLVGFFGHTVANTNQDLIALIDAAPEYPGPGFILPTRNFEVLSWSLRHGLRLIVQANLMTIGLYNEPVGAYMPCILY